ncbi:alpha/beta fold hydrolase [Roseospira marina]|uniref:alpha/beta fold hydrolase n=1 Tax=Roseospira marina TaxID=140057 RepID=UPI0017F0E81F|nr:alpha/beta fold hydrolase [Roseospira marina]MBB4312335.1 dienelactone hydrolase [Roseospira marina]MBB5085649.1 dienelactone hydrolase [Roseospira marina]
MKAGVALVALAMIALALARLLAPLSDLTVEDATVGRTPVTVFRATGEGPPGPAVVVAHGFAGSRQLMQSYAIALARAGYVAVTYDALGHGRHPDPLPGNLTEVTGATVYLLKQLDAIVGYARVLSPGHDRVALLGHSMASDIVVRQAGDDHEAYAGVVAVSMFSPVVTADVPPNLLVVVGGLEPQVLKDEAARVVGMVADDDPPHWGVTYGDFEAGSARRMAISPGVEHIGVLFGRAGITEAVAWLDQAFGRTGGAAPEPPARGRWVLVLLLGVVVLAWPAASLLPRVMPSGAAEPGAGVPWRRFWPVAMVPAVLTPLILWPLPTDWLPVLVGDYLLLHFGLYGALSGLGLLWLRWRAPRQGPPSVRPYWGRFAVATLALGAFAMVGLGGPIELFVANFLPTPEHAWLVPAMMLGTVPFFLIDETLTRGPGRARGAYTATKLLFLLSLVPAIALDLNSLFFLIILFPVIALFFGLFGLFSAWSRRATGHPWVAGLVAAFVFAWCVAVTFPIVSGA